MKDHQNYKRFELHCSILSQLHSLGYHNSKCDLHKTHIFPQPGVLPIKNEFIYVNAISCLNKSLFLNSKKKENMVNHTK